MEGLDENGDSRRAGVRGCRWRAAWKGKWVPGAWPEARGRTAPGPTWSGSACRCGYAAADSTRCRGGSAVRAGLEQAGAVDFDGFDRGRPFGGVVRAVGRGVPVRLGGEHRPAPDQHDVGWGKGGSVSVEFGG